MSMITYTEQHYGGNPNQVYVTGAAGGSTSLGFQGTWTTSDAAPTAFTLNGNTCT